MKRDMVFVEDFDEHFVDIATFTHYDGAVKKLRMYVDHGEGKISYQVIYKNVPIHTGLLYDLYQATVMYNGARERAQV